MPLDLHVDNISLQTFRDTLARYESVVPGKLATLDKQRYVETPKAAAERGRQAHITKSELITLVDWKLSHGQFRPSLRGLALQNAEEDVKNTTREAFNTKDVEAAIKILTRLKGIGPATASLLLSVHKPEEIPFFSDELFRWCFLGEKPDEGWSRKIKYTAKEYHDLVEQVVKLRKRLLSSGKEEVSAVDAEKVAYVLGREALSGAVQNVVTQKAGKKRKPDDEIIPVHSKSAKQQDKSQTRRSGRTKPGTSS